ncbi:hypothetical protein OG785_32400 [Streptomyces sp. NBC_00006]|uniref:hypothetical protein n=1 Tax=Streptomyces sp. NBC_00006 TaxID=2975619 RepID=UPI002253893D|nr:hypothetical protein [Streptomyces sp. NBC_00006]MCX5535237.1 hypothetical protein [Streptomyces sp. NBC_00006]
MTVPARPSAHPRRPAPRPQRPEFALPGVLLGGALTVGAFLILALALAAVPSGARGLPDYQKWLGSIPGDLPGRLQWALGDMTEPQFYKSWVASLGLLAGAAVAWAALRAKRRWAGTAIAYGSGLWPWMLGAATLSLVLSNAVFGASLDAGWQPTFVPFVCVATSVILVYGRGWPTLLTGAFLGAFTTPLAMILIGRLTQPLGLPSVVANTLAMSIGAALVFMLCRALPWMTCQAPASIATEAGGAEVRNAPTLWSDAVWTVRRILTDFTETQFYANEWASIGLIVGVTVTALLNPDFAAYGTGLLPKIMCAQALTSAIGIAVWRRLYRAGGWAPTYVSVVSVAPATVLAYGDSVLALVLGATAGALLCPLVARSVSRALPADFHPFIGNTVAMAAVTAAIVPAVGLAV